MPRNFPIRITSTPRSGTMYTSHWLRSEGFIVAHEKHHKHGIVGWQAAVHSDNVPFTGDHNADCNYVNTWMIFRDPCKTIASIKKVAFSDTSRDKFLEFVRRFIELPDQDRIKMAADFYLKWMAICLEESSKVFRTGDNLLVEQLSEIVKPTYSLQKAPAKNLHSHVKKHLSRKEFFEMVPEYKESILNMEKTLEELAEK